jgi:hypothetical protein
VRDPVKQLEQRWERNRKKHPVRSDEVVAWDGEGWGHPKHVYGLLANSLGYHMLDPIHTVNVMDPRFGRSLKTIDILEVVWRTGVAHPDAYQVTYGGGYDWNHWIGNIDMPTAIAVDAGNPVTLGPYQVQFNGIWFEVRRAGYWVTVWDIWKFFGCGFAQALEETMPDFHGLPMIREFKGYRSGFDELIKAGRLPDIIKYNDLELEAMVTLTQLMFKHFEEARIRRPNALTGAGAVAGSLIVQHQVTQHIEPPPEEVAPAVLAANFGGRIEAWRYGVGPLFVHDIRSAYPYALPMLPSLKGGTWRWVDELSEEWDDRLSVWHVEWEYAYGDNNMDHPTDRGYPFAYRDAGGSVLFPATGRGWQWWPEVVTARALGFEFRVLGGWVFDPLIPSHPFAWMKMRYEQRRRLKANGQVGAARLLKYGLNATWGKTSQARGYMKDSPPPHHSLIYAGWTTSHCRAQILEAASQDWDAVVYMMTDSVAATHRLNIPEGDELGQWEITWYNQAMILQAGVAFLWKDNGWLGGDTECPHCKKVHEVGWCRMDKFRGFDRGSIDPAGIDRAWRANARTKERAPLLVPSSRPVTLGSALTNEEWFAKWNTWQEHWRELDIYGGDGKRWAPTWWLQKPWSHLEPLRPFGLLTLEDQEESAPFEPRWATTDPRGRELVDGVLLDIVEDETVAGMLQ